MESEITEIMKPYIEEQMNQLKDIDNKPFQMVFGDEIKDVPLKKIISGKMVDESIKLIKDYDTWRETRYKELMLLQDKIQKFIADANKKTKKELTISELFSYVNNNQTDVTLEDLTKIYVQKKDYEDIAKLRELDINIFKLLIDTKQISTNNKEEMSKEDFWNEQDAVKIKVIVSFFRAKNAI